MSERFATSFEITKCESPTCRAIHFVLKDERDEAFAQAVFAADHVPNIIRQLQGLAYEIAVMKDPTDGTPNPDRPGS